ncbi:MAG TPA: PAS domain S-box protein, partial [Chitinispirillaceae bacterium]|nr:PAS domain S-box protein [Chitinispirillaceae bacterium]
MESIIRILMLEDSQNNANFYLKLIQDSGLMIEPFRIQTTEDFRIALKEFKPHVILCNIFLEKIAVADVISFLYQLKSTIPLIFIIPEHSTVSGERIRNAGTMVYSTKDKLGNLAGTVKDILNKKAAIYTAETNQDIDFKAIIENSPDIIIRFSPDLVPLYANPAWEKISGIPLDEFLNKVSITKLPDSVKSYFLRLLIQVRSTGKETKIEYNYPGLQTRFIETRIIPEKDANSKLKGLLLIGKDITEKKKIKEQLRYLSEFEKLISRLATTVINADFKKIDSLIINSLRLLGKFLNIDRVSIVLFNSDHHKMNYLFQWLGSSATKKAEMTMWEKPEELPWFFSQINNSSIIETTSIDSLPPEAVREKNWLKESGFNSILYVPLVSRAKPVGFLGFECIKETDRKLSEQLKKVLRIASAIFVNALDRKKTDLVLSQSQSKYRAIFENTGTAMAVVENNSLICIVNSRFCQFTGYQKPEIQGKMYFQDFVFADDKALLKEPDKTCARQDASLELRIIDKYKMIRNAIVHCTFIPDTSQSIFSLIDITDRVQAENRLRNLNSSKSEFVSMASHEMRTPLTGIIGLTQTLLSKEIDLSEQEKRRFLQIIESEGNRLSILLSELLDLTKIETGTTEFNPVLLDVT